MTAENFASAIIEVCADGCLGLWFDADELAKLDHSRKGIGPALERTLAVEASSEAREREQLHCPHCKVGLELVEYDLARFVVVDQCLTCQGLFLDAGELAQIRGRPQTEDERASRRRHRSVRRRLRARRIEEETNRQMVVMINYMS